MSAQRSQRGATTVEMTLVGIPIIFILISVFEISRGMWMYNTAAYAAREGIRFAIVHGFDCVSNPPQVTNSCSKTVGDVATVVQNAGIGLDPSATTLIFISGGSTDATCLISDCLTNATTWPVTNRVGAQVEIQISTPFNSALAMFWPGAGRTSFARTNLGASSSDAIQF